MTSPSLEPKSLLASKAHRLVLKAQLRPVAGLDRFQPAGFPEIGHVLYDAPRKDGRTEKVCIVDSAPSMANHLETVCTRGPHDPTLVPELEGLPYVRCVTGADAQKPELVVTTFTEGHRLASTYFLNGLRLEKGERAKRPFSEELREEFGFRDLGKKSHPLPDNWWKVFATILQYDPNSLVHGILFPQWQIKIPRVLTAVHEAFGAGSVKSSGVKFDKIGKTTSGQPIFAKDEETATQIRATFLVDLALVRSFGSLGPKESGPLGLTTAQKELLLALALWKAAALLRSPFRYRSGCDLECAEVQAELGTERGAVTLDGLTFDIAAQIRAAGFKKGVTDVYWSEGDLFKEAKESPGASDEAATADGEGDEAEG